MIEDAFSNFKRAAVDANIFADEKHGWVALHLFPEALANGFNHRRHAATRGALSLPLLF